MVFIPLVARAAGFGAAFAGLEAMVFAAAFLGATFLAAGFAAFFWTGLAFAATVLVFTGAAAFAAGAASAGATGAATGLAAVSRSEEHTSELQSLMRISYAVFCLKKKTTKISQDVHE